MTSDDVLKELVRSQQQIRYLRFFSFSNSTKLQDRLTVKSPESQYIIDRAQRKKEREGIRFWNALLSTLAEEGRVDDGLVAQALYHQPNKGFEDVEDRSLAEFLKCESETPRAVNSKVLLDDGSTRHIPLLDFKIHSKQGHDDLVLSCIRSMGLSGHVLDSGRSYHFIGDKLISESELFDLLANFVLLDPLADRAWAAHQLIERSASLRVSAREGLKPQVIGRV